MNFAIKDSLAYPAAQKSYRIRTQRCYRLVYWLYRTKTKQSLIILKRYILLSQSLEERTLMVGTGVLQKMEQEKDTPKVFTNFFINKGRATSTNKKKFI